MTPKQERTSRSIERRAKRPAHIDPHQLYSIDEGAAALDTSRMGVYELISAGRLRTVRIDSRQRIPGAEIIRIASSEQTAA
jgi:excisionase family DNA binding protein